MKQSSIREGDIYAVRHNGEYRPVRITSNEFGGFLRGEDLRTHRRLSNLRTSQLKYLVCAQCAESADQSRQCRQADTRVGDAAHCWDHARGDVE